MAPLTKEDVAAFKQADVIVVHHLPGETPSDIITLTRKVQVPPQRGFEEVPDIEVRRVIEADATVRSYDRSGDSPRCSDVDLHASMHDSAWNGPVQLLRVGDELMFTWIGGNNTETMRDAGLSADELWLTILRRNKRTNQVSDGKTLCFLISYRVAPKGSTARMIGGF